MLSRSRWITSSMQEGPGMASGGGAPGPSHVRVNRNTSTVHAGRVFGAWWARKSPTGGGLTAPPWGQSAMP